MQTENKNKPTESQVQALMSDWLGNLRMKDESNFTHKGRGGIVTRKRTGTLDYLLGDVDGLDKLNLMKAARQAARNVVSAVVNEPSEVMVGSDASFHAHEDGKHTICLASDYFDDTTLSNREKAAIMLGLASHEAAHGAYTDEDDKRKNLACGGSATDELRKNVWNLLEDERIEYHLGEDRPGLSSLIGETKGYYFNKLLSRMKTDGKLPTEPLPRLLNALTQAIRYPSQMDRRDIEENYDDLDAIRRTLTPYPLTSEDCWKATDRIMDILKDKVREDMKEQQKEQEQDGQGQQAQGNNESSSSSQGKEGQEGQDRGKKNKGRKKQPSEQEVRKEMEKALSTQQAKNVLQAMKADGNKADPANQSGDIRHNGKAREFVNDDDAELTGGPGEPKTFILCPEGNVNAYTASLNNVRAYIPAMSKVLACKTHDKDYVLKGMRSGKLNMNKLVPLVLGSETVFTKQGSIKATSASVCILIDESGSMSGSKTLAARDAAVLVNEAIARIHNVNFFCYGYTDNQIRVFNEQGKSKRWALGATDAIGGTPTGKAMEITAKRIRGITRDPCLMLVMTDGAADSSTKVKEADAHLRADRFIPVGVGIQSASVHATFKESIVLNDMSEFAYKIGEITRGKLDRMIVRRDNND